MLVSVGENQTSPQVLQEFVRELIFLDPYYLGELLRVLTLLVVIDEDLEAE